MNQGQCDESMFALGITEYNSTVKIVIIMKFGGFIYVLAY